MYLSFIVNVSELNSTKSRPSPGSPPAAQWQRRLHTELLLPLRFAAVCWCHVDGFMARANKAFYLEEIATSSCDLHKIDGSLMLTTLTIENQARSDKRSPPPLLSFWSLYLKGTLRLSPWSWEPWGRKWGTKSQNGYNDSLLLPLLHEVCASKVSRCRYYASLWFFHSQATRLSNKDSKIPGRQEMQYNILCLV